MTFNHLNWNRSTTYVWPFIPNLYILSKLAKILTPGGTRTHNLWIRSPTRYPLRHWGLASCAVNVYYKSLNLIDLSINSNWLSVFQKNICFEFNLSFSYFNLLQLFEMALFKIFPGEWECSIFRKSRLGRQVQLQFMIYIAGWDIF